MGIMLLAKVCLKASLKKSYSSGVYLADVLQEGEEERRVRFCKEVIVIKTTPFPLIQDLGTQGHSWGIL
jgi:hypothetical protein